MADTQEVLQKLRAKFPGAYDDLSDDELLSKLKVKYPQYADLQLPETRLPETQLPTPQERLLDRVTGGTLAAGGSFVNRLLEAAKGAGQMGFSALTNPAKLGQDIRQGLVEQFKRGTEKAGEAIFREEPATAIAHGIGAVVPGITEKVEQLQRGQFPQFIGETAADVLLARLPVSIAKRLAKAKPLTPIQTVKNLAAQVGPELERRAAAQASNVMIKGVQGQMRAIVDTEYDAARSLAAQDVATIYKPSQAAGFRIPAVKQTIVGPISYQGAGRELSPVYEELRAARLVGLDTSPAFQTIEKIVKTPPGVKIPLASAIDDLRAINSLGSFSDLPELRKIKPGLAAKASGILKKTIFEEVTKLTNGPEIIKHLEAGIQANKNLHNIFTNVPVAKTVRGQVIRTGNLAAIAKEPVKLQSLLDQTRGTLKPIVARQVIEDLTIRAIDPLTGEFSPTRWGGALRGYSAETRKMLFTPAQIKLIENPANLSKFAARVEQLRVIAGRRAASFITYRITSAILRGLKII